MNAKVARKIMEAAHALPERFGRKVFIAQVWQHLSRLSGETGMPSSYEEFKTQLIAANRAGLIGMSRMDLMVPRLREIRDASVVEDAGSTWHFIDLDPSQAKPEPRHKFVSLGWGQKAKPIQCPSAPAPAVPTPEPPMPPRRPRTTGAQNAAAGIAWGLWAEIGEAADLPHGEPARKQWMAADREKRELRRKKRN